MDSIIHILILICIYYILTASTQLLVDMGNLMSLCQAAFFGIGAYITALVLSPNNIDITLSIPIVIIVTGLIAFIIAIPAVSMKDDYFILATLCFQFIIYTIFVNVKWNNGVSGTEGLGGIEPGTVFGQDLLTSDTHVLILILINTIIVFIVISHLINSPFGRTLKGIKNSEVLIISLGRSPKKYKMWTFVIAASFAGLSGYLYATYSRYINPSDFNLDKSILILAAVIIGGTKKIGPVLGAALIVLIPEISRRFTFISSIDAPLREVIYGMLLLAVLYIRLKKGNHKFQLG